MNLLEELKENQRRLDSGEIDKNEFEKRKKTILSQFASNSKEDKKTEPSHDVNQPKNTEFYDILQLKPDATDAEIRLSYRKLALKHHPDKNGGIETEEWNKLSNAYKILSDKNSRSLYDNYGSVNDSLAGKASFNPYVGGDSWQPYIGDLEIGLWMFSIMNNGSSPEINELTSNEQKEQRRAIRISNVVRYIRDKLSRFPKQDSSEFESFEESLLQEAQKLLSEPNGKELLSSLGGIYVSKAQAHLNRSFMSAISNKCSNIFNGVEFTVDLISGFLAVKTKGGNSTMKQEEINKVIWRLSRTEISSIARETCDKILNNDENDKDASHHLANSLLLLGKVWLEASKQSKM
ncbi:hypothetical protein RclHR1_01990009 [Rhizophagus clarus]|uniref:J domain-containing protein n=1 Tax=Rhizophagus clarus TaxID=94130 RepID=A0A2Z6QQ82_9GLOM|nr:hypothetical protein RclHR1_01990009 [Rhizophagus clarus]